MEKKTKTKWVNDVIKEFDKGYGEYLYGMFQEKKPWNVKEKKLSIYLLTAVSFNQKLGMDLQFFNHIVSLEELEQSIKTPIKVEDESKISFEEYEKGIKWYLNSFINN